MAGRLNGLLRGVFAAESFVLSQAYYYGSVRRNPLHRVHVVEGRTLDLDDDLDEVWLGPPEPGSAGPDNQAAETDAELVRQVVTGERYHGAMCSLAARYIGRGVSPAATDDILRGLLLSHPPEARDERWRARFGEVGAVVASAAKKFQPSAEQRRARAALTGRLIRAGKGEAEIVAEVDTAAEATDVAAQVARSIVDWVAQQELSKFPGGRGHV